MLYAFAFARIGVVVGDLYFLNPNAISGREGAKQGVRLEVRLFERGELRGSTYSAQPIAVGRPLWRADLLESVDHPGTLNRAHHHPQFADWDPCKHVYVDAMTADPVGWVGKRLEDLETIAQEAGLPTDELGASDAAQMRAAVPEIVRAIHGLLERVRDGEFASQGGPPTESARVGWL